MYIPKLYRQEDHAEIMDFLRSNNFAAIVSSSGGLPTATHTPVEIIESEGGLLVCGHISRANPQWKNLGSEEVLLIFQGAHTYISPRWYDHVNVPTWNYKILHLYGCLRELQGQELFDLLSRLVKNHEDGDEYQLEKLPPEYVQQQMKGIFGFAIEITRLEASYKLSQNRDDLNHASIIQHLQERPDEASHEIAESMRKQRPGSKR